jgi:hypothetical protein
MIIAYRFIEVLRIWQNTRLGKNFPSGDIISTANESKLMDLSI